MLECSKKGPSNQISPDSKPQRVTDHSATSWPAGRILVEETPETWAIKSGWCGCGKIRNDGARAKWWERARISHRACGLLRFGKGINKRKNHKNIVTQNVWGVLKHL